MPSAWRIFKPRHAETAFTGEGAQLHGGRWNSPGKSVVYTAGSASLAALELLVHLSAAQILNSYLIREVTFDDDLVSVVDVGELPDDWRSSPPPLALRRIGDHWVAAGTSAVLRVPSAVIETEHNYLLNPANDDFAAIELGVPRDFLFDDRLSN